MKKNPAKAGFFCSKARCHGYDNGQEAVLDVVSGKAYAFIYGAAYNVVAVNKVGAYDRIRDKWFKDTAWLKDME